MFAAQNLQTMNNTKYMNLQAFPSPITIAAKRSCLLFSAK